MAQRTYPGYEQWSIDKLVSAVENGSNETSEGIALKVPRFQRSVVWGDDQKRALINSIFDGFPVGSLLLHERIAGGRAVFQLVDGLQRTTTITDYMTQPLALAPVARLLDPESVQALAQRTGRDEATLRSWLAAWARERKQPSATQDYDWHSLADWLIRESGSDVLHAELKAPCQQLLQRLADEVLIGDVILPVVIYRGPDEHLPNIFERINSQGTTLSKYEVFAASWFGTRVRISDPKVRDAIEEKYEDLRRSGFALGDGEIEIPADEFTLFEYLFGLGRVLADNFPELFEQPSKATDTVPAAFVAATAAHGLRISAMARLSDAFPTNAAGIIDPTTFQDALLKSCGEVADRLRPVLGLRLNRRSKSYDLAHSQNQVLSIVVRYLVGQFDPDSDWAERHDGDGAQVLQNVRSHYLYDILGRIWRGSGDNRLFDRVWRPEESGAGLVRSSHYATALTEEQWRDRLRSWFDEQLLKQQRSRAYVRAEDRLFLRYVYARIVNVFDDQDQAFDIEHLIPVARLQKVIPPGDAGWPISCVANLALFEQSLNREKSAKTISEYLEQLPADKRVSAHERVAKYVISPDPDEVDVPKDADGQDAMTRADYDRFLHERFESMVDGVLEIVLPSPGS